MGRKLRLRLVRAYSLLKCQKLEPWQPLTGWMFRISCYSERSASRRSRWGQGQMCVWRCDWRTKTRKYAQRFAESTLPERHYAPKRRVDGICHASVVNRTIRVAAGWIKARGENQVRIGRWFLSRWFRVPGENKAKHVKKIEKMPQLIPVKIFRGKFSHIIRIRN